jgi:hypothetical protein
MQSRWQIEPLVSFIRSEQTREPLPSVQSLHARRAVPRPMEQAPALWSVDRRFTLQLVPNSLVHLREHVSAPEQMA